MMDVILHLNRRCKEAIAKNIPVSTIMQLGLFDKVVKMKYDVPNNNLALLDTYKDMIDKAMLTVQ